jgi:hypothetical protein
MTDVADIGARAVIEESCVHRSTLPNERWRHFYDDVSSSLPSTLPLTAETSDAS